MWGFIASFPQRQGNVTIERHEYHLEEGDVMKNLPKWLVLVSVFVLIVWALGRG